MSDPKTQSRSATLATAFWAAVALGVLIAGVWPLPALRASSNSYDAGPRGKRLVFDILSLLYANVQRNLPAPVPPKPPPYSLLVLGPQRHPTPSEQRLLAKAVADGATLVFAASASDTPLTLEVFGVTIEPARPTPPGTPTDDAGDFAGTPQAWLQSSFLKLEDPHLWTVLVEASGKPRLARRPFGRGSIVVCCSAAPFENLALADPRTAELGLSILQELPASGTVYVDEYFNRTAASMIGMLFDEHLRIATVQILLWLVLLGWSGAIRFGAARPLPPERPPSIVRHARVLGRHCHEAGDEAWAARRLLAYLSLLLRKLGIRPSQPAAVKLLARRAQWPEQRVYQTLAQARAVASGHRQPTAKGRHVLRPLTELIRRVKHGSSHEEG